MTLVRRLARPMLAGIFITGGLNNIKNPGYGVAAAQKAGQPLAERVPYLPTDPEQLVKINGYVHVGAGALLALGKLPRLSALALAGALVPTTLGAHSFWEETDPGAKTMQQIQFLKNLSILGGLLLAAVDTEGNPGLSWRAKRAATHTGHAVRATQRTAQREARLASKAARTTAKAAAFNARRRLPAA
ncbi:MAG: DoxX family protein [Actinomycetota bacterium]|nr:DoxX family protein [Actinomycetota bacterium]